MIDDDGGLHEPRVVYASGLRDFSLGLVQFCTIHFGRPSPRHLHNQMTRSRFHVSARDIHVERVAVRVIAFEGDKARLDAGKLACCETIAAVENATLLSVCCNPLRIVAHRCDLLLFVAFRYALNAGRKKWGSDAAASCSIVLHAYSLLRALSVRKRESRMQHKKSTISIDDRFRFGSFGLRELAALRGISVSAVRDDVRRGLLPTFRHGRRRLASGPDAAKYLQGEASP